MRERKEEKRERQYMGIYHIEFEYLLSGAVKIEAESEAEARELFRQIDTIEELDERARASGIVEEELEIIEVEEE